MRISAAVAAADTILVRSRPERICSLTPAAENYRMKEKTAKLGFHMEIVEKKRQIFISAHPADRYAYLDQVIAAVNSTGTCAAVYNPVPGDKGPELPEGVDTLVLLASIKYFTWANSGYDSEYAAAVRDGIRVIPVMIEPGPNVIDLINMRCGKTQYIDATEDLGFGMDTLRAHLTASEREVDESLPSVFISYRRADKEHLYKLVKIIESAPAYGGINLWYDEIIAPGENYSKAITRQLENCDLFILLVTPNLLEKSNYVWRVEYKTAKAMRKRILAIEAEKTDKKQLADLYWGLGRIADIRHPGAVHAVIDEIASLPRRENTSE